MTFRLPVELTDPQFGTFRDEITYTEDDYAASTPESRDADAQARFQAWRTHIMDAIAAQQDAPPPPDEPVVN